jgi:hypothetical protein
MAQTTKPATCSQLQPSHSTKLTQLSTSSPVPVTTSVLAATKSPPDAVQPSVDTQKRVVCSNTRLYYPLPLPPVRLSSFQSIPLPSLSSPSATPPTIARTTHNSRRVHISRRCFSSLPLRYPRCQSFPHLRGHRKLYTRSSTRTPPVGGMDRPLCARCVYSIHPFHHLSHILCHDLLIGANINVDTHLPIPPHLRDLPSIFLEDPPTGTIYGTDLRSRDQTPSSSAPRATGLGFFTPDAADPSTRSRAQQQNTRYMLGSKDVLTRNPQSVPRALHKLYLLTP